LFVTLNETTANYQVAIIVDPRDANAKAELLALAEAAESTNNPTQASALLKFANTVNELAQPIQKFESADGTDNDTD
jgi:hypothetical protein